MDSSVVHQDDTRVGFEIPSTWITFITKFGFATALALALLWFLGTQIVIPMREDQKAFMQSVIETNKQNAATHAVAAQSIQQMTSVQQTQSATLSTLVDQQKQTTTILQQIRDDQRAGAWREAKPHP